MAFPKQAASTEPSRVGRPAACAGSALAALALMIGLTIAGCASSTGTAPADAGYSGILCGEMRVDPRTDMEHCGRCYNRCYGTETCIGGICQAGSSGCDDVHISCGGGCVDPLTDPRHCGDCNRACPGAECIDGDCAIVLPRDGGGSPVDGGGSPVDGGGSPMDGGGATDGGLVMRTDGAIRRADGAVGLPCLYEDLDVCLGDQTLWCRNRFCGACETGFFNCDNARGCECEAGCDGDTCLPEFACNPAASDPCGTPDRWCYEGHPSGTPQCRMCSDTRGGDGIPDSINCDGTNGCEYNCPGGMGPCTCP